MNAPAVDRPAARPAQFDSASQHRRGLIGKIHVGKRALGMVEDDYRALLFEATGRTSLTECSESQLEAVVAALKTKGFKPVPTFKGRQGRGRFAAGHPVARKARALWISLHHLGVVDNPSEYALEEFAKRQLKCERFEWARQSEGYRVIEALKSMAKRAGWPQYSLVTQKPLSPIELKSALCEAILRGLKGAGETPADWDLNIAAFRLCGIELGAAGPVTADQYDVLAKGLGEKLRAAIARGAAK